MPSHRLAKRAACLEVVKRLHAIGEMNDNLHAFPLENIFEEDEFDERDIQRLPDISAPGRKKIVLNDQVSYSVRVRTDVLVVVHTDGLITVVMD